MIIIYSNVMFNWMCMNIFFNTEKRFPASPQQGAGQGLVVHLQSKNSTQNNKISYGYTYSTDC